MLRVRTPGLRRAHDNRALPLFTVLLVIIKKVCRNKRLFSGRLWYFPALYKQTVLVLLRR